MHRVTLRVFLALFTLAFTLRADDPAKTRFALVGASTVTDCSGLGRVLRSYSGQARR